jgi:hypothetical protein
MMRTDDARTVAIWVDTLALWKVFATHTFSWEASLWSARRVYERFMCSALPTVSYFYAIEQNPSRDGHHVHAMWDSLQAPRKATHKEWLKRYGRNRIEPVRDFGDVVSYCAKYVCKEGVWWDFHLAHGVYERHLRQAAPAGRTDLFADIQKKPVTAGEFLRKVHDVFPNSKAVS